MSDPTTSAATVTVAVDAGSRDVAAAEHLAFLLAGLLPAAGRATYVSTHVAPAPSPHVVVVASWTDDGQEDPAETLDRLGAELPGSCLVLHQHPGETVLGPAELRDAAREALVQHRTRAWGRLVDFPGRAEVVGLVSVGDLVAGTCVDEVRGLAGLELTDETLLDLGDFFRPTWHEGRCTLLVQASPGAPVPFEVREQIACCSDH